MQRRHRAFALALVLLLNACAARSTPVAGSPPPEEDAASRLRAELDALFTAGAVAHAQWGVDVYSMRDRATVYSLEPGRFLIPASNQKILTAAVAAERLGWDHRFTTRILATAPVTENGTTDGDLVVIGDGDPTINPRHPLRWRAFDDWAVALRAKGITVVNGRLIGDDNAFDEPAWGIGWAWDNLQYGYGAPPSALQFHENQIEVIVGPGMASGARAIISTAPYGSGVIINNGVTTIDAGETVVEIARVPDSPYLTVNGQIAAGAKPVTVTASVHDPTRFYLTALRDTLARHGITINGVVADADQLEAPPDLTSAVELIVDRSPPLDEIVDVAMKWSRNIYAETLLLAAAPPGAPASGTRGLASMRETLARWEIGPEGYLPRDGSGLSRYDFVSAATLTRLLRHLASDPSHAQRFASTLPEAGVSGTLAARMKGTPAEGRVRAKTGTLSNVRTLAGYVTTLDGDTLAFAMLANNFTVRAADIDAIMESALNRLVQSRRSAP